MNLIHSLIPSLNRNPVVNEGHHDKDLGPTVQPNYEIKEIGRAHV